MAVQPRLPATQTDILCVGPTHERANRIVGFKASDLIGFTSFFSQSHVTGAITLSPQSATLSCLGIKAIVLVVNGDVPAALLWFPGVHERNVVGQQLPDQYDACWMPLVSMLASSQNRFMPWLKCQNSSFRSGV